MYYILDIFWKPQKDVPFVMKAQKQIFQLLMASRVSIYKHRHYIKDTHTNQLISYTKMAIVPFFLLLFNRAVLPTVFSFTHTHTNNDQKYRRLI